MSGPELPSDDEIHAYVDDALAPSRRREIAQILDDDAALARRVAAYQADRDGLQQALMGALTTPMPAAWEASIEAATRPRRTMPRRRVIAAGLAVAASAAIVAVLRPPSYGVLEIALAARETIGDGGVESDARLAAALGLKLMVPDLHQFGFHLAGLQLIRPAHAAQLAYRDARDRRLTIYVRPSDGSVRFDLLKHGNDRVCIWQDDVVSAVIIAPMPAGEMMRVASSAYAALNL